MELIARKIVVVPFRFNEQRSAVADLVARYSNVPMSLADACLVRMSEQIPGSKILTLDGDFVIYRKNRREEIPTLIPDGVKLLNHFSAAGSFPDLLDGTTFRAAGPRIS